MRIISDPHPERYELGDSFWTWSGTRIYGAQPDSWVWQLLKLGGLSSRREWKTRLVSWLWRDGSRRSESGRGSCAACTRGDHDQHERTHRRYGGAHDWLCGCRPCTGYAKAFPDG